LRDEPEEIIIMPTANPTPIPNQFYKNLKQKKDFIAYRPWGDNPNHTNINNNFIAIANMFVKQFDYPQELQKLIDYGWKKAKPTASQPQQLFPGSNFARGPIIGNGRSNLSNPESPFKGFTEQQLVSDWDHMRLFEQVAAYAFRGDTRTAEQLEASDGFFPPYSRTDDAYKKLTAEKFAAYIERKEGKMNPVDKAKLERNVLDYLNNLPTLTAKTLTQYELWRAVMDSSRMHLQAMTDDSFMKSYISTTRDIAIAAQGANGSCGGTAIKQAMGDQGWIYVLRVESGFMVKTGVGGISKKEAEIAHLGPIKWKDVYGFRHMSYNEDSNIYIRRGFYNQDDVAFKQVLGALSWCFRSPNQN
jgi:hypothetical protein